MGYNHKAHAVYGGQIFDTPESVLHDSVMLEETGSILLQNSTLLFNVHIYVPRESKFCHAF